MRIVLGAAFLAALAALAALAVPRGIADLRAFEARHLVFVWEARRIRPPAAEWTHARELLREARALDPLQPAYPEEIGRLYHLRALALAPAEPLAQDYARQALEHHREAARRRPGSPYTWANIALLKGRIPEPDAEFEAAIRNAAALGPWEPEVQIAVADAGFVHWARLAPETRAAVRADLERALRWQDAKLFELARRTGRLDLVCALPGVARSPRAAACI